MTQPQRMVYQTEKTRERIISCAVETFLARGFFDAQMKDIAEFTGLSRHTLYRYYQDKFDLAVAVLERITDSWSARILSELELLIVATDKPALARVEMFIREMLDVMKSADELQFVAEFDAFSSSRQAPAGVRERLMAAINLDVIEPAEALLRQGQLDGSIRDDKNPRQLVFVLMESLFATQQRLVLRGELLVELQAANRAWLTEELLELMLRGIAGKQQILKKN